VLGGEPRGSTAELRLGRSALEKLELVAHGHRRENLAVAAGGN
jgi:hypothetical protein